MKDWFENKIREHGPEGEHPMGVEFSIDQLVMAWRGLGGEGCSIFGISDSSYISGQELDVEAVCQKIVDTLSAWLGTVDEDDAVALLQRLERLGMTPQVSESLRSSVLAQQSGAGEPSEPEPTTATPQQVDALLQRLQSLPRTVSADRWSAFVERLERLFAFVQQTERFYVRAPLRVGPPLNLETLADVQANLDRPLPDQLLEIAAYHAGSVHVAWQFGRALVESAEPSVADLLNWAGGDEDGALFSVEAIPSLLGCRDWELEGAVTAWTTAVPVGGFGPNYLAIETSNPGSQPVLYLSHEEGALAPSLAENFMDFLERWLDLELVDLDAYCMGGLLEAAGFDPKGAPGQALAAWYRSQGLQI